MNTPFDLIFGISAVVFNLLIAGVFLAQRYGKTKLVRKLGIWLIALGIPFALVLFHTLTAGRNQWVRIGLAVVLAYLLVELLTDYILKIDFRSKFITHFPYILLEYGAFAGLLYTAFTLSIGWGWAVSITFWVALAALTYNLVGKNKRKKKR